VSRVDIEDGVEGPNVLDTCSLSMEASDGGSLERVLGRAVKRHSAAASSHP
jgi:hypothetical protein